MKKMMELYKRIPILFTFLCCLIIGVIFAIVNWGLNLENNYYVDDFIIQIILITSILVLPVLLVIQNIIFFIKPPKQQSYIIADKKIEILGLSLGLLYSYFYMELENVTSYDWYEQASNSQLHAPIATDTLVTIVVFLGIAIVGYFYLRFAPVKKQAPLAMVIAMSGMYLGIAISILWCIQIGTSVTFFPLLVVPINFVIIIIKTIRNVIRQFGESNSNLGEGTKFTRINKILRKATSWPLLALGLMLPLLGILIMILVLFGQEPDAIIKAWTQTADWTLSQRIAPQNIMFDEHYLCTVAAGGHKSVVKPIRNGRRHGHQVIVNRQLCIANAFEQLLEERIPSVHKAIRGFYDNTGYPIAKYIKSPFAADVIYILMKPLEWFFLVVLYLFDAKPENRIAIQYPHKKLPTIDENPS